MPRSNRRGVGVILTRLRSSPVAPGNRVGGVKQPLKPLVTFGTKVI